MEIKRSDISDVQVVEGADYGPAKLFRQDRNHRIKGGHMSDGAYAEAVENMVIVCADVVFYDPKRKKIYLATRRSKPMDGLWWIGGRVRAGETSTEAILRNVKRETGLTISPDDLETLSWMLRYQWSERQQVPQNVGSDNLCYMFWMPVTAHDISQANARLDPNEYDVVSGLVAYDRFELKELRKEGKLHPVILDVYDEIFPSTFQRFRTWLAGIIA